MSRQIENQSGPAAEVAFWGALTFLLSGASTIAYGLDNATTPLGRSFEVGDAAGLLLLLIPAAVCGISALRNRHRNKI